MSNWSPKFLTPTSIAAIVLLSFMLVSCQSFLADRVKTPVPSLRALKDGAVDPVRKGGEEGISLFKSVRAMVDKRVRPSTTVTGKKQLTLHDCRSLALANNLDLRVAQFQELAKRSIEYSAKTKMLPNFLVSTELAERDNIPYRAPLD